MCMSFASRYENPAMCLPLHRHDGNASAHQSPSDVGLKVRALNAAKVSLQQKVLGGQLLNSVNAK